MDISKVLLTPSILDMESVTVEEERAAVSYAIDKKVISVSQMQTAISGTASDVLENVPSITVDIEGNVSLRGSSNFAVLIDGRPTILEASDALEQIPASSIKDIEIITNPSAKYDPEGTSGIINIIMKKNMNTGRAGLINLNGGIDDRYGGDILFENKTEKYTVTFGVDYRNRFTDGFNEEENHTTTDGVSSFVLSDGNSRRGRNSYGLRGAFEYRFNPKNIIAFNARYGDRDSKRISSLDYQEWSSERASRVLYNSNNDRSRGGYYYAFNTNFTRKFAKEGHELIGQVSVSKRDGDEITINRLLDYETNAITEGRRSLEAGPSEELEIEIEYVLPLKEDSRFEAGYESEFDRSTEETGLADYNTTTGEFETLDQFSNTTKYQEDEQAFYSMFAGKWKNLGVQSGMRVEYTNRKVGLARTSEEFTVNRWDFFPSVHTSFQLSEEKQLMASYTRRIDRPRGYYLEPFETWMDAYNVRMGNPNIKPEYIDSYEAGFQTFFGKNVFSTEVYYRVNHDKIERIRSAYADNVTLHTVDNVGTDYALGSELMLNLDLVKNWNINLMGNLYNYRIEGVLYEESFERESFSWSTRFNNQFKLGKSTQLQINARYNSGRVSSQGSSEGYFSTDLAVRQDFFEKRFSATVQIRDVLNTAKWERTSQGADFYSYDFHDRESPIVVLNLRYNINNYRQERNRDRNGGDEGGDFGEDDF
ncbi:TonB-dependent receptor [candidate division KSB1 bacterium]|nr:TonB-dependent receptor [candidate division KSB1 bacterium]NIR72615.1 TonB-dependent receptor [candidate division KSB1 bacterium]NIS23669.1 TonB-dependent receptor [candidate division KSB1 bacterium]NIT70879.1 TonB-dependent receptor [candidate division KSB1 bacterium]NIU24311.1 TonB-dependent receptor [candidate division KSB1 bacterium]